MNKSNFPITCGIHFAPVSGGNMGHLEVGEEICENTELSLLVQKVHRLTERTVEALLVGC